MASVIYHPAYRNYSFGGRHPFSPLRVDMTLDLLRELGHEVRPEAPEPATREQILDVHADYYVRRVEALSAGEDVPDRRSYGLDTPDTPAFRGMDEAARWHVGGTLTAARRIIEGDRCVLQLGGGFHHARSNFASGFCVYNDLALAIRALAGHGLWVAYIDVDVHHGDGVQQILYDDGRVMTISLHESGEHLFPGSGDVRELGAGVGRGLKLNVPLEPLTEGASYLEILDHVVPSALSHFRPGVLVVQAGADAHSDDQLGDLLLTTRDYEAIFRRVLGWADAFTSGRVLFTLGGGYSFHATPRVWALLYLLVNGLRVPEETPAAWRQLWRDPAGAALPVAFHDPVASDSDVANRDEIARRNRDRARRLLEAAAPHWA
ncbi:MAG TPA: acetoin utilization protein AcuC [Thermoanaerobaculia bacterium]|jgi:acetoin utilization protein AcuC|nr:acetoin utilization protein AcuC [Thermoanaerobaculia bacterium]